MPPLYTRVRSYGALGTLPPCDVVQVMEVEKAASSDSNTPPRSLLVSRGRLLLLLSSIAATAAAAVAITAVASGSAGLPPMVSEGASSSPLTSTSTSSSYSEPPLPFRRVRHPMPPNPSAWAPHLAAPLPTGSWWTNAVLDREISGEEEEAALVGEIVQMPYALRTAPAGLEVSYSADRRLITDEALTDVFAADLVFKLGAGDDDSDGGAPPSPPPPAYSRTVEDFDELSLTFQYGQSDEDGGGNMRCAP